MVLIFKMFEIDVKERQAVEFINEIEKLCKKYAKNNKYFFEFTGE